MNDECGDLRTEIAILEERISKLESKERKRKAFKYIKMLFTIAILSGIAFGVWKSYDYIKNSLPNYLEDTVKDLIPGYKKN